MLSQSSLPFHNDNVARVNAPIEKVFAYLDDPRSLSAHMGESSMMTMGMRMVIDVDAGGGREIGSKICLRGSMMGIRIALEEVVTERQVPSIKVWETIGTPRLLVIAQYRMGFEVTPQGSDASQARVFIDYSLPSNAPGSWLGYGFGGIYGRWCTQQMVMDAARHFK